MLKNVSSLKKILLGSSVFLFFCFVFYSYLVAKERFTQFDFDTTVKLQDRISQRWDYLFSTFSVMGSFEVTTVIWIVLTLFMIIKRWWLSVFMMFFFVFAHFLEIFGKLFVYHPGPPFMFYRGEIEVNFFPSHYVHTNYSYPSGHMMRTAFLVTFLMTFLILKVPLIRQLPIQAILIGYFAVMAISRVYLGEHWTTDVVGGALLGSSLGILAGATIPLNKQHPADNTLTE